MKRKLHEWEQYIFNKDLTFNDVWEFGKITSTKDKGEIIGIYQIYNKKTNKSYIGSSKNILSRLKNHVSSLKNGNHSNEQLKKDAEKFGVNSFTYNLLEVCYFQELSRFELKWLTYYYENGLIYNEKELKQWHKRKAFN